jgi:hypothetical protein
MLSFALVGCGGLSVEKRVLSYRQQQAHQLVVDYEQARGRNDLLSMCVKGNLVSAAYRDAHDAGNAVAWEARRAADCDAARAALAPSAAPTGRKGR